MGVDEAAALSEDVEAADSDGNVGEAEDWTLDCACGVRAPDDGDPGGDDADDRVGRAPVVAVVVLIAATAARGPAANVMAADAALGVGLEATGAISSGLADAGIGASLEIGTA